ncbi:hypothetical protein [Anaerolinea thermophila]|uniref:Uncharacterized protein n=1 Tax=Anaerolinea thermophila (strain DSM 14523 / JCM 11388 / NBRC 100420 / UNI-1) TaxID=926569 RepID=E8N004_ANATU|nr:hypothetical protein [Anaerolinea thermophila]BAJ62339.1 hypothetical protein ANT_03050 [Anaerolinea thermophila UNI-1]
MELQELVIAIAEVGKEHPSRPLLHEVEIFRHFFVQGEIDWKNLDQRDGSLTRRETLTRFLLLCAVLDQGPDIEGIRRMLIETTNELYRKEIRFLHKPISFFSEIGVAIDEILARHEAIKNIRARVWAEANRSNPARYNLFMDNASQVLGYAIFRWGVPLSLPYLLEKDRQKENLSGENALLDYLESYDSAERMTQQLKDHSRYGLGKAIGDKASHLFGKWLVSSFRLTRQSGDGWDDFSYEVPYDSNAGRVLWRTGFLLHWADEEDFKKQLVLQSGKGKGNTTYLRVTNLRGMKAVKNVGDNLKEPYEEICLRHLKTHKKRPKNFQIQQIQHIYLWQNRGRGLHAAHFDDGLIFIGTHYCFNHDQPDCQQCPINTLCMGYSSERRLIRDFRT